MASAITHGFVGLALAAIVHGRRTPRRVLLVTAACSILPDADAAGFALGVPYASLLGHRGLSHSLAFAAVTGLVATAIAFRELRAGSREWWSRIALLSVATASHGALDALTTGGHGVAFFAPFALERHFFPWRPIAVSPISVRAFFSAWGLRILANEAVVVWLPALVLMLVSLGIRRASPLPSTAESGRGRGDGD